MEPSETVNERARANHVHAVFRVVHGGDTVCEMLIAEGDATRFKRFHDSHEAGVLPGILFLARKGKVGENAFNFQVRLPANGEKFFHVFRAEAMEAGIHLEVHFCACAKAGAAFGTMDATLARTLRLMRM